MSKEAMIGKGDRIEPNKQEGRTFYSLTDRRPDYVHPPSPSEREAVELFSRQTDGPKPCNQIGCKIPVEEHGGGNHVHENYDRKMAVYAQRRQAAADEIAKAAVQEAVVASVGAKFTALFSTFTKAEADHFAGLVGHDLHGDPGSLGNLLGRFRCWGLPS